MRAHRREVQPAGQPETVATKKPSSNPFSRFRNWVRTRTRGIRPQGKYPTTGTLEAAASGQAEHALEEEAKRARRQAVAGKREADAGAGSPFVQVADKDQLTRMLLPLLIEIKEAAKGLPSLRAGKRQVAEVLKAVPQSVPQDTSELRLDVEHLLLELAKIIPQYCLPADATESDTAARTKRGLAFVGRIPLLGLPFLGLKKGIEAVQGASASVSASRLQVRKGKYQAIVDLFVQAYQIYLGNLSEHFAQLLAAKNFAGVHTHLMRLTGFYKQVATPDNSDQAPFFIALSDLGQSIKFTSHYDESEPKKVYQNLDAIFQAQQDILRRMGQEVLHIDFTEAQAGRSLASILRQFKQLALGQLINSIKLPVGVKRKHHPLLGTGKLWTDATGIRFIRRKLAPHASTIQSSQTSDADLESYFARAESALAKRLAKRPLGDGRDANVHAFYKASYEQCKAVRALEMAIAGAYIINFATNRHREMARFQPGVERQRQYNNLWESIDGYIERAQMRTNAEIESACNQLEIALLQRVDQYLGNNVGQPNSRAICPTDAVAALYYNALVHLTYKVWKPEWKDEAIFGVPTGIKYARRVLGKPQKLWAKIKSMPEAERLSFIKTKYFEAASTLTHRLRFDKRTDKTRDFYSSVLDKQEKLRQNEVSILKQKVLFALRRGKEDGLSKFVNALDLFMQRMSTNYHDKNEILAALRLIDDKLMDQIMYADRADRQAALSVKHAHVARKLIAIMIALYDAHDPARNKHAKFGPATGVANLRRYMHKPSNMINIIRDRFEESDDAGESLVENIHCNLLHYVTVRPNAQRTRHAETKAFYEQTKDAQDRPLIEKLMGDDFGEVEKNIAVRNLVRLFEEAREKIPATQAHLRTAEFGAYMKRFRRLHDVLMSQLPDEENEKRAHLLKLAKLNTVFSIVLKKMHEANDFSEAFQISEITVQKFINVLLGRKKSRGRTQRTFEELTFLWFNHTAKELAHDDSLMVCIHQIDPAFKAQEVEIDHSGDSEDASADGMKDESEDSGKTNADEDPLAAFELIPSSDDSEDADAGAEVSALPNIKTKLLPEALQRIATDLQNERPSDPINPFAWPVVSVDLNATLSEAEASDKDEEADEQTDQKAPQKAAVEQLIDRLIAKARDELAKDVYVRQPLVAGVEGAYADHQARKVADKSTKFTRAQRYLHIAHVAIAYYQSLFQPQETSHTFDLASAADHQNYRRLADNFYKFEKDHVQPACKAFLAASSELHREGFAANPSANLAHIFELHVCSLYTAEPSGLLEPWAKTLNVGSGSISYHFDMQAKLHSNQSSQMARKEFIARAGLLLFVLKNKIEEANLGVELGHLEQLRSPKFIQLLRQYENAEGGSVEVEKVLKQMMSYILPAVEQAMDYLNESKQEFLKESRRDINRLMLDFANLQARDRVESEESQMRAVGLGQKNPKLQKLAQQPSNAWKTSEKAYEFLSATLEPLMTMIHTVEEPTSEQVSDFLTVLRNTMAMVVLRRQDSLFEPYKMVGRRRVVVTSKAAAVFDNDSDQAFIDLADYFWSRAMAHVTLQPKGGEIANYADYMKGLLGDVDASIEFITFMHELANIFKTMRDAKPGLVVLWRTLKQKVLMLDSLKPAIPDCEDKVRAATALAERQAGLFIADAGKGLNNLVVMLGEKFAKGVESVGRGLGVMPGSEDTAGKGEAEPEAGVNDHHATEEQPQPSMFFGMDVKGQTTQATPPAASGSAAPDTAAAMREATGSMPTLQSRPNSALSPSTVFDDVSARYTAPETDDQEYDNSDASSEETSVPLSQVPHTVSASNAFGLGGASSQSSYSDWQARIQSDPKAQAAMARLLARAEEQKDQAGTGNSTNASSSPTSAGSALMESAPASPAPLVVDEPTTGYLTRMIAGFSSQRSSDHYDAIGSLSEDASVNLELDNEFDQHVQLLCHLVAIRGEDTADRDNVDRAIALTLMHWAGQTGDVTLNTPSSPADWCELMIPVYKQLHAQKPQDMGEWLNIIEPLLACMLHVCYPGKSTVEFSEDYKAYLKAADRQLSKDLNSEDSTLVGLAWMITTLNFNKSNLGRNQMQWNTYRQVLQQKHLVEAPSRSCGPGW